MFAGKGLDAKYHITCNCSKSLRYDCGLLRALSSISLASSTASSFMTTVLLSFPVMIMSISSCFGDFFFRYRFWNKVGILLTVRMVVMLKVYVTVVLKG